MWALTIGAERVAIVGILVVTCVLVRPAVVTAQNRPAGEIAGGYQFMWHSDRPQSPFPAGWFVSGADYVTDDIALLCEVAGSHRTVGFFNDGSSFNYNFYTYMGGARFYLGRRPVNGAVLGGPGTVNPFVQVLAGAGHLARSGDSAHPFLVVQPGGGVDISLTDTVATRLMVDFRQIVPFGGGQEVRFAAGIVIGFGNR